MHSIFPRETAQMVQYENKSYIKKKKKNKIHTKTGCVGLLLYIFTYIYIFKKLSM